MTDFNVGDKLIIGSHTFVRDKDKRWSRVGYGGSFSDAEIEKAMSKKEYELIQRSKEKVEIFSDEQDEPVAVFEEPEASAVEEAAEYQPEIKEAQVEQPKHWWEKFSE